MAITKFDDFLLHQSTDTSDHVVDSDPRWFERNWMCLYSANAGLCIGMAMYPNLQEAGAFAHLATASTEVIVTAMSTSHVDRYDMGIGPFDTTVERGSGALHMTLTSGNSEFSYDVLLENRGDPIVRDTEWTQATPAHNGLVWVAAQAASVSGWILADGKRLDLRTGGWHAVKTHVIGVRAAVPDETVALVDGPERLVSFVGAAERLLDFGESGQLPSFPADGSARSIFAFGGAVDQRGVWGPLGSAYDGIAHGRRRTVDTHRIDREESLAAARFHVCHTRLGGEPAYALVTLGDLSRRHK